MSRHEWTFDQGNGSLRRHVYVQSTDDPRFPDFGTECYEPDPSIEYILAAELLHLTERVRQLEKVCATQAAVIDYAVEKDHVGVNVNAIVGVGLRLQWSSEGDLSWIERDEKDPETKKIWDGRTIQLPHPIREREVAGA